MRYPMKVRQAIYNTQIGRTMFSLFQRLGVHVTPNHYYSPIPDTQKFKDDLWAKRSSLSGINMCEEKQLEFLSLFELKFKHEYEQFPRIKTCIPYRYYLNNSVFESVDAEILYCMIRHFKPRRIYEIGSGYSTYLSAQAVLKNYEEDSSCQCELVAIEPYPNKILKDGFPGLSRLIPTEVQNMPVSEFKKLSANDILFIDSSHVLRTGNDVQYEYLDILPVLDKGVIVHVHDIFLPAEYPKRWILQEHKFWTEQYLLQAFLAFNESYEVLWAGSYMHLTHPEKLELAFSSYCRQETWPGSFWFKKVKGVEIT